MKKRMRLKVTGVAPVAGHQPGETFLWGDEADVYRWLRARAVKVVKAAPKKKPDEKDGGD